MNLYLFIEMHEFECFFPIYNNLLHYVLFANKTSIETWISIYILVEIVHVLKKKSNYIQWIQKIAINIKKKNSFVLIKTEIEIEIDNVVVKLLRIKNIDTFSIDSNLEITQMFTHWNGNIFDWMFVVTMETTFSSDQMVLLLNHNNFS